MSENEHPILFTNSPFSLGWRLVLWLERGDPGPDDEESDVEIDEFSASGRAYAADVAAAAPAGWSQVLCSTELEDVCFGGGGIFSGCRFSLFSSEISEEEVVFEEFEIALIVFDLIGFG